MKKIVFRNLFILIAIVFFHPISVSANNQEIYANIRIEDEGESKLVDPEFPNQEVNPGKRKGTEGQLRFDYISDLSFGYQKINQHNRVYESLAQLFYSDTNPRGYYLQVSDFRSETTGWNLTVTQENQFTSYSTEDIENSKLEGAVLSFDNGWANTNGVSDRPNVTRDAVTINEMGIAYNIATALNGQGKGVWLIEFGASNENVSNQKNTLTPLLDDNGERILDSVYNKQLYSNSAVYLTIPESTRIYPTTYTTTLTWTLESGP